MPDDSARIHGRRARLIDDEAVFAQAISVASLEAAWGRVLGNGGAAGGGVTVLRSRGSMPMRLARLRRALASGAVS